MHLLLAQGLTLPPDTPWTAVVVVAILLIAAPVVKRWLDNRIEEVKREADESKQIHQTLGKQTDGLIEMVRNQSTQTQTLSSVTSELRANTTALTGSTEKVSELAEEISDLHQSFEIAFKGILKIVGSAEEDPTQIKAAVSDLRTAVNNALDVIKPDETLPPKEANTLLLAIHNTTETANLARKTGEIEASHDPKA